MMHDATTRFSRARARLAPLLLLLIVMMSLTMAGQPVAGNGPMLVDGTPVADDSVVMIATERERPEQSSGKQVLRLPGLADDPASLDPALARDQNAAFLTRQIFRGLTRLDSSLAPVPELAERIEISPDGRVYTFRLRAGATFQDGSQITADDVVRSFARALDPDTAGGDAQALGGAAYLGDIVGADDVLSGTSEQLVGARVRDARTIELRLQAPSATFLMRLAGAPAAIVDPDDVARGDEWWRSPNGSGPFRIDSWEPGKQLTLAAVDDYVAGAPLLRHVNVLLGPAASQPFNLYQADQVDITGVPSSVVGRVIDPAGEMAAELIVTPVLSTNFLAFRADVAPMDDPHIRRAVQLAYPREKLVEVGYGGSKLVAEQLVPPAMLDRGAASTLLRYDPDEARRELAASSYGAPSGVPPIRIYGASAAGAEVLRTALRNELDLDVEVIRVDWPAYIAGLIAHDYPAFELTWTADYPDPATYLWSLFASSSPDNYLGYHRPEVDQLLGEAAMTIDPEQRTRIYQRVEQLVIEDAVVLPLYHDIEYTLAKPDIRGLEITPLGLLYLDSIWLERS
jgi:ABC-type oligopeptide transport system substrate-binding subunit